MHSVYSEVISGVTGKVDDETLAALANSMRQENRHMSEFHEPNVPRKQAHEEALLGP
jgi:hypothetical protein